MNEIPRFPSLFYRQRLNAAGIPMLGGVLLFLLLPEIAAPILLCVCAVAFFFLFRREGEARKTILCFLAGIAMALLLMGNVGMESARMESLCHTPRTAQGYVVAVGDGTYDLALTRLDGKSFRKQVRVETDAPWKQGEKRCAELILYSPNC